MKKYIEIEPANNANALKIEVYYNLGGINYFTGRVDERGYYISVTPVERARGMESFVAFTGAKQLIHPVKRQSAKAESIAHTKAETMLPALIEYVAQRNGLVLKGGC